MDIRIEPAALDYIKAKSPDNIITLDVVERPGGVCSCHGGLRYPSVQVGKPKIIENYELINIKEMNVYYRPILCNMFSGITIIIDKLLFIKSLVAIGDK
ncbi:Hypothetical protein LUCI_1703 [Lucifera butyrica]|uniref:Fes cluster biogenesis n=1 Tax=Lucifera butyrica TaxID=1351585 RepID=A0A498R4U7_9FIRM|nr:CC/Se motif family (seleno)protein [Lucifera butyrica]VBB06471.1 Hypothetical protein LUCI_1703 [Lucifera butyrica]